MMILYQSLLIILAGACYAITSLWDHRKLVWSKNSRGFWGTTSDWRKYKVVPSPSSREHDPLVTRVPAPDTFYYRFFEVRYQEAFPGSATIFVFATDGYHLTQWLMIKAVCLGIAIGTPYVWTNFVLFWSLWTIVFAFSYKIFGK